MDIIVKYGSRSYIFHSQNDVSKADGIYLEALGQLNFEQLLEDVGIEYDLELPF